MELPVFLNDAGEFLDTEFHPGARHDVLLILAHGLTGNKDRPLLKALAEGLSARGWPCLRISYSGHGESEGRFKDMTITKEIGDLFSIIERLPHHMKLGYIGHSMGGAVGTLAAARDERIRMLVTLCGMVQTAAFCDREFGEVTPGEGCMWDEPEHPLSQAFVDDLHEIGDTLGAATAVAAPWLLVHSADDDLIPLSDSREAYAAAEEPKRLVEIASGGHAFDEATYPQVIEAIDGWLREQAF